MGADKQLFCLNCPPPEEKGRKERKFTVAGPITNMCRKQKLLQSQSTFNSQLSGYKDLWWNAEFIRQRELIASLENPYPFPEELVAELNDAEMICAAMKLWEDILAGRKVGVFGAAGTGKTFLIRAWFHICRNCPSFGHRLTGSGRGHKPCGQDIRRAVLRHDAFVLRCATAGTGCTSTLPVFLITW